MEKSFIILYRGDIASALEKNGLKRYMVLNNKMAVVYVDKDFDENALERIKEVNRLSYEEAMNSLIDINGNDLSIGETVSQASGVDYIENNPYITATGKNVLIAIIDSGIDYLHPDFINKDKTSKIISIWDQSSDKKSPPEGTIFGSEFTREDINKAILENDNTLTIDEDGTGTVAAGICSGLGNLNSKYSGVATGSELVVVKLRQFKDKFKEGIKNYINTDFLAAVKYVIDVSKKEKKFTIINLTVAERSYSVLLTNLLDTFDYLNTSGVVVVSGAGNEGNTDIHYEGNLIGDEYEDVKIQVSGQKSLSIILSATGPDKVGAQIISPSGELSNKVMYTPDNYIYTGKFNIENSNYTMRLTYPWILSGSEQLSINIEDIKPGIWTLRIFPEYIIGGEYDIYLPNKKLISEDTRFIDPNSFATITMFASSDNVITIGAYDKKTDSLWIGSSKGPIKNIDIKPDIIAPGVNIISTYINKSYVTSTGTGVSGSIVCGVLAIIMEYIASKGVFDTKTLFTRVLRTYLMLGAEKKEIYTYPNKSEGYGNLSLENTIKAIANIL